MMVQSSFYSDEELLSMGFKSIGKGCMISRKASFYGVGRMSIGNNVRIDDFCILSGSITLANNIHISAYVALYGAEGIEFEDYTGISARSTIYSAMDDFSGEYLVGPIHPEEYTRVTGGKVTVKAYTQIGANVLVFPNHSHRISSLAQHLFGVVRGTFFLQIPFLSVEKYRLYSAV